MESKNLPCPTWPGPGNRWPPRIAFASLTNVLRPIAALVFVAAVASPARADKASNPAFLGVGMEDAGGPCVITSVERGSGAEVAALQPGDVFDKLDGTAVPNCNALVAAITARAPGALIKLDMRRASLPLKVKAELLTRDEILRRRLVGQTLPPTELVRVDDRSLVDLSAVKRTTIVGWYSTSCQSCDALLAAVARRGQQADKRAPVAVLAATAGDLRERRSLFDGLDQLKLAARTLDAPLLAADYDTYTKFAMKDVDRVHFMVIDCRGTVQYVAPIVPNTNDTDAVLDELFAAAEQTARRMTR